MYSILFTEEATRQFTNIKSYIKYVLLNNKAATDFDSVLREKLELLKKEPYLFPFANDSKRYRKMKVKNYIALYSVNEQTHTIHITAIVYAGSNYIRKLK